jgi:hypothetical protein
VEHAGAAMKLMFYKTVQGDDGNPMGELVMIVEEAASRLTAATQVKDLPATAARMANWRQFADFFEIV